MESLISQDALSVRASVQQYLRDAEPSPTGLEERSHLAQLCTECVSLFQSILKTLPANSDSVSKEKKMMSISLKRSYGRMKIWADENGATDGAFDAILAASPDLQREILKYIVSISETLADSKSTHTSNAQNKSRQRLTLRSELINFLDIDLGETGLESISTVRCLTAAVTEGNSDNSSESGFSDSSSYSVNGVLEDLKVDTTCLQDLETILCSPILRTDPEPTAMLDSIRMTWSPHQHYSDKVSVRFPLAADELVNKLGKANYERYMRCQEQKATNELAEISSDQTATAVPDGASSKFHDSGIGSSLQSTVSPYAETVMSYGMGEGRRVRVPPLPAHAKEGVPFACVACGKWVKIATNSAWKKHVYGDLRPWICLEADCHVGTDAFSTRSDWITHLVLDHETGPEWRITKCPLCRTEIGPGKLSITRHMGDHLEEISLSALPVDCKFEEDSERGDSDREDDNVESIDPKAWLNTLALFHMTHIGQLGSVASGVLSKNSLTLFDLDQAVEGLGGYEEVSELMAWGQVCRELGFGVHEVAKVTPDLRNAFIKWILPYQQFLRVRKRRLRESPSASGSEPIGADRNISTLTEKASEGSLFQDMMERAANSHISMDEKELYLRKAFDTYADVDKASRDTAKLRQLGKELLKLYEDRAEFDDPVHRPIHLTQQEAFQRELHAIIGQRLDHIETPDEQDLGRLTQVRHEALGFSSPLFAPPVDEEVRCNDNAGEGTRKQQTTKSLLKKDDEDPASSPPPHSDGYCPGWTPEASFDWGVDITSGEDRLKGKGKREARMDVPGSRGNSGDGDWFSSAGQGFSSFATFYSSVNDGAPGEYPGGSSS